MINDPQHYALTRVVFYAFIGAIYFLLYQVLAPFLVPLAWAGVLAVTVFPIHRRLLARMPARRAAILTTLLVMLLLILPALLFAGELGRQAFQGLAVVQAALGGGQPLPIPGFITHGWDWAQSHLPLPPVVELKSMLSDGLKRVAGFVAGQATGLIGNAAMLLVDLMVTLFALFFFLKDAPVITDYVRRLLPFSALRRERLIHQTRDLVFASVTSSLIVAMVQGAIGGIIFLILGIHGALFWGLLMCFLALLPAIGTALVWLPTALWLLGTGEMASGITLLVLGFGLIGSVDNVLRPILLSGHSEMNELLTFISLLGGIAVFGFLGVVLGPVLMATALTLLQAYLDDDEQAGDEGRAGPL